MKLSLIEAPQLEFKIQPEALYPAIIHTPANFCPSACSSPLPTISRSTSTSPQRAFLKKILPYALYTQRLTGIPASVTLAQAALESGWGKHAPGNNFFGIKGKGPAGSQWLMTSEFRNGKNVRTRAEFRRYHDPLQSFLDHAKVISEGRYLRHAMQHTQSAEAFVHALQSGKRRYATDPGYSEKIMSLIHRYQLEKYDHAS